MAKLSNQKATYGRMLLAYSYLFGAEPRPAIAIDGKIVRSPEADLAEDPDAILSNTATVGVILKAGVDAPIGDFNTLHNVDLFDPMDEGERSDRRTLGETWLEWMPYQIGQAKKTEAAEGDLAKRIGELEHAGGLMAATIESLVKTCHALALHVDPALNTPKPDLAMDWAEQKPAVNPNDPPKD